MIVTISVIVFAILTGVLGLFQLGLTLGMPWGEASMGGKFPGKYPPKMRVISLINSFVLGFIGIIVLIKADLLFPQYKSFSNMAINFVVVFSAVAIILNATTPRKIWLPVAVVLLITIIIVTFITIN
jgi:hypothetical protein